MKILEIIKDKFGQYSSTRFCGVTLTLTAMAGFLLDGFNFFDMTTANLIAVLSSAAVMLGVKDFTKKGDNAGK